MYDYPKYSNFLNQELSPDIDGIARALARKFNWTIKISGESALYYLNLSIQITGNYIYLSSGPSRSYKIGNTTLKFRHRALKNIVFKYQEGSLLVQALKSLGETHVDDEVKDKLISWLEVKKSNKILMVSKL